MFGKILKTFGPRLLGSLLAGGAAWVGAKTQGAVTIDPEVAAATVTSIFLTYSAAHRAGSSKFNPGDAAKSRVADAEKQAADIGGTVHVERSN